MTAPPPDAAQDAPPGLARGWALCVATYNRRDMLADCVSQALASDLPPQEIVIVDASNDWAENQTHVQSVIALSGVDCPLLYAPAQRKSLTVQRNQIVRMARADILFMIDDDAMLHPGTARRIMEHYRSDPEGRIIAISARNMPLESTRHRDGLKQISPARELFADRLYDNRGGLNLMLRLLLMIPAEQRFVGYDRPERRWHGDTRLPEGLFRVNVIVGFALTLRRAVALREPFDEGLVGSAIAEDLDASYRFGRHGLLAIDPEAGIDHLEAAAGRDKRRINAMFAVLNVAYFLRRNSDRQLRDFARYALWYLRMIIAELPKDLAGRRWTLPQLRGVLMAGPQVAALLLHPREGLPEWYRGLQMRLIAKATRPTNQNVSAPQSGAHR